MVAIEGSRMTRGYEALKVCIGASTESLLSAHDNYHETISKVTQGLLMRSPAVTAALSLRRDLLSPSSQAL